MLRELTKRELVAAAIAVPGIVLAGLVLICWSEISYFISAPRETPFFPVGLTPLFLAVTLVPGALAFMERRRSTPPWFHIVRNVVVALGCVAVSYLLLGAEMFAPILDRTAWDSELPTGELLASVTAWSVLFLVPVAFYAVEQTSRGWRSRVVLAVGACAIVVAAGLLWQARLSTYYWYAGFFEHGWLAWLGRTPLAGGLLLAGSVAAAARRLRGVPPGRTRVIRGVTTVLAAIVIGLPYRQPARWRADDLEEIGFAAVTSENDLLVVASRHSDLPEWYRRGALLRRRAREQDFECLTRSSVMPPRVSMERGTFASLDLVAPWDVLLGAGARMRLAALDGSCSRTTSRFDLPRALGVDNDWWGPYVRFGPGCTCIHGNGWSEDAGAIWLADGRTAASPEPPCGGGWLAGNRLVVVVDQCEGGVAPCLCCGSEAKLITVDLLSGQETRRKLSYPTRVRRGHARSPSGERFTVQAADSSAAWLCDLDGRLEPIEPLPEWDTSICPNYLVPVMWADDHPVPLDQAAFRSAVLALGKQEPDLEAFDPSASLVGSRVILIQRIKGEGYQVYELDPEARHILPLAKDLVHLELTPDSLVMLECLPSTRRVVRYWPASGHREVLLTAPTKGCPTIRHTW